MKAIKLTYENYRKIENALVIDDNGNKVKVGNQIEIFIVSDEDNQHSHTFVSFDNDTTIQHTHKGCYYVSGCDLRYELELYLEDAKNGVVDSIWSEEIEEQILNKIEE